jgi:hypothetical protein
LPSQIQVVAVRFVAAGLILMMVSRDVEATTITFRATV